uniref:NudC domain containing 2 n=3 Tax=Anas TaxID=8835 RepID=A0A493TT46_ANAPP
RPRRRGLDGGALRGAQRRGALPHALGPLVPDAGGGVRGGARAARHPGQGRELQPAEPTPGAGRGGPAAAAEDRKLIRIVLMKTNRDAGNCWTSLLENDYAADPWVQDQMQRKLTLERFQRENPGFDFSGAEISGNYSKGGPDFFSLEK